MPCTYTGSLEGDRAMAAEKRMDALVEARDEMTALACAAFQVLEQAGMLFRMTPEQRAWWERHKEADRIRKEKEMSLVRRCTECDAGEHEPHHDSCSQREPSPAEKAVEEKLMEFVCRGGGDQSTLEEFARSIVSAVRNSKETA